MYRAMMKRAGCGNPSCLKTHWNVDEARACSEAIRFNQVIEAPSYLCQKCLEKSYTVCSCPPKEPGSFPQLENPAALTPSDMVDALAYAMRQMREEDACGEQPRPAGLKSGIALRQELERKLRLAEQLATLPGIAGTSVAEGSFRLAVYACEACMDSGWIIGRNFLRASPCSCPAGAHAQVQGKSSSFEFKD